MHCARSVRSLLGCNEGRRPKKAIYAPFVQYGDELAISFGYYDDVPSSVEVIVGGTTPPCALPYFLILVDSIIYRLPKPSAIRRIAGISTKVL